jgi:hypothetical protein
MFTTHFGNFNSNIFLALKNSFWKFVLHKFLGGIEHECTIYMTYYQFVVKKYLDLTHSVKLGMKNEKNDIID